MKDSHLISVIFDRLRKYVEDEGDCRIWTGVTNRNGFARASIRGKVHSSLHRFIYENYYNVVVDARKESVIQTCGKKNCLNALHMKVVSRSEALKLSGHNPLIKRDGTPRRQSRNGGRGSVIIGVSICPKGHLYTQENTYIYKSNHRCRTCTRERDRMRYNRKKQANPSN